MSASRNALHDGWPRLRSRRQGGRGPPPAGAHAKARHANRKRGCDSRANCCSLTEASRPAEVTRGCLDLAWLSSSGCFPSLPVPSASKTPHYGWPPATLPAPDGKGALATVAAVPLGSVVAVRPTQRRVEATFRHDASTSSNSHGAQVAAPKFAQQRRRQRWRLAIAAKSRSNVAVEAL